MARTQIFSQVARALRIARFCHVKNVSTREGIERVAELEHARHYRLSRRQFLMGAGATMTGLALGTLPLVRHVQAKRISGARIAIVGGGLAGLACAYELQRRGVLATVYEGNPNRIGGRCHSDRVTFPGQVAELGGEMIDNLGKTMLRYAQEFNLTREDYNKELGDSSYYFFNQRYRETEVVEECRELAARMRRDWISLSNQPTCFSHTEADVALDHTDLATYLDTRAAGLPLIRAVFEQAYIAEYGLELHQQSCLNLLLFFHLDRRAKLAEFGVFNDERYHLVEGSDAVAANIRNRLEGPVEMGTFLQRLSRNASGRYVLEFQGVSTPQYADAVVLAIPFSVLRGVVLDASLGLSTNKLRAINNLGYGNNAKTVVSFTGRPWFDLHHRNGFAYSDLPNVQNTWETNYTRAGATSILTDYAGGDRGRALQVSASGFSYCLSCHGTPPNFLPPTLTKTVPQTQIDNFLTDLDKIFPGAKAAASLDANNHYIANRGHWLPQAYSRGSYTCYRPGQFTSIAGLEGQSAGLLKFAGEQANSFYEWQGFMEGAALSGLAAAGEILGDMAAGRL